MVRNTVALAALWSLLLSAPAALAQNADFPMGPQFAAKLMLGLGGEVELDPDGTTLDLEDDLEVTWGVGVHFLFPVIKWFAIGGQIAVQSWKPDFADDSNVLLDIVALPAGLLPVSDKVQLYASVPVGISFDFVGDDDWLGGIGDIGTGFGFTIGLMLGAQFALSDSFGLLAELGYVGHGWEHEAEATALVVTVENDVEVNTAQFALNFGAYF